jgi:hypothetical protein
MALASPRHLTPLLFTINFNMANEIADNFDLFGIVIRDLYASEFIFDQYCQLETIEPWSRPRARRRLAE